MTQKTEIHGIVKVKEGILMSDDIDGLKKYRSRKLKNKKLQDMQTEFEVIKEDIGSIKRMLEMIASKL